MSQSQPEIPDPVAQDESKYGNFLETVLPRFSLNRRVTILVLVATLVVLGVVATMGIPIELIPNGFTTPFLRVSAPWQDAPPQEVLDKVVLPLEEELSTVSGLSNMFSFGRSGFGQVFMAFKQGTDMDVAYREVRDRVERAKARLPDDLQQVFIHKDDDTSMPVGMIGLAVEEDTIGVYDLIQNEIILPLERVEGVATVSANGLQEKEILIELDRERVDAAGLNIFEIAQDLARDNFSMASGNIRAGDRKLLLRSVARYRQTSSVEEVLVAPSVRLGDIANISYAEADNEFSVRVNSRPAYAMMVMKEGDANTLEVARRVNAVTKELQKNPRLQSMMVDMIMDQGLIIKESLSTLLSSGRVGAMFALVVLFFFLRRVRMSVIIALSIPLSMVIALVVMYFAGESLNLISLLGLMISVGLLVDNSVVVAENIHRLHRSGESINGGPISRREATIRGTGEIALAVTTATLTTMIVFLPVSLVEGMGQFFLLRLAIPIAVSLFGSLFVALTVVPLAVYLTLEPRKSSQRRDREAQPSASSRFSSAIQAVLRVGYDKTFGIVGRAYSSALSYFLKRRLDLVLGLIAIFFLTSAVSKDRVGVVAMSEEDSSFIEVDLDLPRTMTFDESHRYFLRVEKAVEKLSKEFDMEFYVIVHGRNWGEIQGAIAAGSPHKPKRIVEELVAVLPDLPGLEVHHGMASQDEKEDALDTEVVSLYGEEAERLDEIAKVLEDRLETIPGVLGVKRAAERAPNELALIPDRDLTQRQEVNPTTLATMVGYALRGQPLPRVYLNGRDIPVRVRFEESDRSSLAELGNFSVPGGTGEAIPLTSLVDVEQLPTPTTIFRRNKQTVRRITVELEDGQEEPARESIYALMAATDLPEGVSFGARVARGRQSDDARNMAFAAMLSIMFVYLLMGFLFESFMLPISILVTIPLANLGVTWMHLIAGRDIDFLGLVGLIILIGVVVNNGIVLVDYVRRLRDRGHERAEALILATERRFRPIMMTALTTICGMIPLTLGTPSSMGMSYKSFGLTLIGGMVTSSFLTLLVVPVFYTLVEDARAAAARVVSSAFGRGGRGDGDAEPVTDGEVATS